MSNKKGFFEEALETGTSFAKQTGKAVGTAATDTTKAVVSQTGLPTVADTATDDFVKDLYGVVKNKPQSDTNSQQNPPPAQNQDDVSLPKSSEEQQRLQDVRSRLQKRHDEFYYEPLVNPKKDKPEERPAEKVEIEKQEDLIDLQKKEEKKPPPLVTRNQQRVEKFPGSGG